MTGGALRLVLVRHGLTDWNAEGRFQGHLDPPLSADGRWQADLVSARVAGEPELRPVRIVSSSLRRASETAAAVAAATGAALETDRRLIEIGQGEWEGRTHAEIAATDAERYEVWRTTDGLPPGGETIEGTMTRVTAAIDAIRTAAPKGPVVVVSHGGTLRVLARILLGLSPTRSWAMDVDNASIGEIVLDGAAWRLDRWNDTGHLLGRAPTHVDEDEGRPRAL